MKTLNLKEQEKDLKHLQNINYYLLSGKNLKKKLVKILNQAKVQEID